MVAVKVTFAPRADGFGELERFSVGVIVVTVCVQGLEVTEL
jgi:hypothetical protein